MPSSNEYISAFIASDGGEYWLRDIYAQRKLTTTSICDDANDETSSTIVKCDTNTLNTPNGNDGVLIALSSDNGYTFQIFVEGLSQETYLRLYSNNSWGTWDSILSDRLYELLYDLRKGSLSSKNLDTLTTPGIYWTTNTSITGLPTLPSGTSTYGFVEVWNTGDASAAKIQRYHNYSTKRVWERQYTNNQWYAWTEILTNPNSYGRASYVSWSTSASITTNVHVLAMVNSDATYMIWLAGDTDIWVRNLGANTTAHGTSNTTTLNNITFKRSGKTVTVTTNSSASISLIAVGGG